MTSTVTIDEKEWERLKALAGESTAPSPAFCGLAGHTWKLLGGANAGCGEYCQCSRSVYVCVLCHDCDYGENEESEAMITECKDFHPERHEDPVVEELEDA